MLEDGKLGVNISNTDIGLLPRRNPTKEPGIRILHLALGFYPYICLGWDGVNFTSSTSFYLTAQRDVPYPRTSCSNETGEGRRCVGFFFTPKKLATAWRLPAHPSVGGTWSVITFASFVGFFSSLCLLNSLYSRATSSLLLPLRSAPSPCLWGQGRGRAAGWAPSC